MFKDSKQQIKLKLCSKRFFNQSKSYIEKMNKFNAALKSLYITKIALIPLLPKSLLAIRSINKAIKLAIVAQEAFSILKRSELNYLILKKCQLNISPSLSFFYKLERSLKLKRKKITSEVILKEKWKGYFCQGRHLLSIQYSLTPKVEIKTSSYSLPKKALRFWNSSLGCSLFQSFLSRF